MRTSFAVLAAVVGLATATPHGGYGEYESVVTLTSEITQTSTKCTSDLPRPTTTVPAYPAVTEGYSTEAYPVESSTEVYYPVPSSSAEGYPVEYPTEGYPVPTSSVVEYPTEGYPVPSSPAVEYPHPTEGYPVPTEGYPVPSSTVTVPYPTGTGYPVVPVPSHEAPYPIPSEAAPYPIPSGTGYPPAPPAGTATGTGYVKPSSPAEFTGAASHAQIGGFVAGVGAFAAFFL